MPHLLLCTQAPLVRGVNKIHQTTTKLFCKRSNILSWIALKFGRDVADGRAIDLRLTHQELSELIGSSRVTVTRLLCALEREELLFRTDKQKLIWRASLDMFHPSLS